MYTGLSRPPDFSNTNWLTSAEESRLLSKTILSSSGVTLCGPLGPGFAGTRSEGRNVYQVEQHRLEELLQDLADSSGVELSS